jgi:hypothetical protein
LNYDFMPVSFDACEIRDLQREPIPDVPDPIVGHYRDINTPTMVGKTKIQAFEVFHPDPCLGYRIEHNGHTGVGSDFGLSRLDWGHGCIEDVVEMTDKCNVK